MQRFPSSELKASAGHASGLTVSLRVSSQELKLVLKVSTGINTESFRHSVFKAAVELRLETCDSADVDTSEHASLRFITVPHPPSPKATRMSTHKKS